MSIKANILTLLLLLMASPAYAETQMETNEKPCGDYREANQKLSDSYTKILTKYASDKEFIKNIKASQQAWLTYRDAQMKARFPHTEPGYYGSVYPVCDCNERTYLTNARIKELRQWLKGTEEGDVCSGSIRVNK